MAGSPLYAPREVDKSGRREIALAPSSKIWPGNYSLLIIIESNNLRSCELDFDGAFFSLLRH